jgi:hypothetical protein
LSGQEVGFVGLDVPVDMNLTLATRAPSSADAVDVDVGASGCVENGSAPFDLDGLVVRLKNNLKFFPQIASKASNYVQIRVCRCILYFGIKVLR